MAVEAQSSARIEAAFDAVGDPIRRRILERLRHGPSPVGKLADGLPVGRPAVSKHLKILEGAGLVEHRSHGTRNLYALAPDGLAPLQQWLVSLWDATLDSFADRVRSRAATPERPAGPDRTERDPR